MVVSSEQDAESRIAVYTNFYTPRRVPVSDFSLLEHYLAIRQ